MFRSPPVLSQLFCSLLAWSCTALGLACSSPVPAASLGPSEPALKDASAARLKAAPSSTNSPAPAPALPSMPPSFPCGEHQCFLFEESRDALLPLILSRKSQLIAFGEAHKPADYQGDSTVKIFTQQLLPTIAGGASHLLVELLQAPSSGCATEKKKAQKEAKKVTDGQAKSNQNEYLLLGHAALQQGITPDILHASCQDMSAIAAPEGGVITMMETIQRLSEISLKSQLKSLKNGRPLVLAYGGALHNDVEPHAGRETWSYGPSLLKHTNNSYLEIDLIVPELIGDTPGWKSFKWYEAYQELQHSQGALLMKWGEHSYSLFFSPTKPN